MLRRKRKKGVTKERTTPIKKSKKIIKRKKTTPAAQGQRGAYVPPRLREDRTKIDYKKRAKRNKRRRRVIMGVFLFVILLCVMFFAPFFGVSRIEVKGQDRMTQEQVAEASGVRMGENIFSMRLSGVKKRVEALPYTRSAKVQRGFPNVIKITVEEANPFAYIRNNDNQFILINLDGKMLEITDRLPEQHMIQLITQKIEDPVLGQTFSEENSSFLKKYLATIGEIVHNNNVDNISLIDVSNENELNIRYNQLEVKLGDAEKLEYKFSNLKAILEKIGEKAKGSLDLSIPGKSPYRELIE